eukprot:8579658-Alexandrium_andersonii.AAC.1
MGSATVWPSRAPTVQHSGAARALGSLALARCSWPLARQGPRQNNIARLARSERRVARIAAHM